VLVNGDFFVVAALSADDVVWRSPHRRRDRPLERWRITREGAYGESVYLTMALRTTGKERRVEFREPQAS
jgi:hypothetical protein